MKLKVILGVLISILYFSLAYTVNQETIVCVVMLTMFYFMVVVLLTGFLQQGKRMARRKQMSKFTVSIFAVFMLISVIVANIVTTVAILGL
ncbi:MAG: hypothetical protein HFJ52_00705 [Clostridia bacterium]|nr:hypothetical protein [Clostridia bacterium]